MTDTLPPLASYPRINPAFTAVVVNENEVHFTTGPWSGPVFEIADDDEDDTLADLISMLDGSTHVEDILETFDAADRDEVVRVLSLLQRKSIVREADDDVDDELGTVAGYLSIDDADGAAMDRLSGSDLVVVGSGAVGRRVVANLLGVVGEIRYLDVAGDADAWASDLDALALREPSHLTRDIDRTDFAALALDRPYPSVAARLNELAFETRTPWTVGVVNGVDGQVGPTVYPGETACYDCFEQRADAAASNVGYRRFTASDSVTPTLLPAFAGVVAGMLGMEIVQQLSGGVGITTGSVVNYDFYDFAVQAEEVLRQPRCPTCGKDSQRLDSPRHVTIDYLVEQLTEEER